MFFHSLVILWFVLLSSYASAWLLSVPHSELPVSFSQNEVIVVLKDQPIWLTTFSPTPDLAWFSFVNQQKNIWIVSVQAWQTVSETLVALQNDPRVLYAQPNYVYTIFSFPTPTDSFFPSQWWLDNQWQALQSLWTTGVVWADIWWLSGMNIFTGVDDPLVTWTVVAVIDNGVLYTHEDLQNRMWSGTNCLNQNGGALWNCLYGYDFYSNDNNPVPAWTDRHGTHVSGILWASHSADGVAGVNPNARIMALRAGAGTSLSTLSVVNSIWFAQYNWAKVINASFGGTGNDTLLRDTIESYSWLFIAAAWNQWWNHASTPVYPCDYNFSHVICVGAFNQKDTYASFSDYGSVSVDVAAPWEAIASTFNSGNSAYAYSNGTSMATPFVAGIASLLRSYYPQATRDQVRQAILSGVVEKSYLSGKVATSWRVNLYNSLLEMQAIMLADAQTPSPFWFTAITWVWPNTLYTSNIVTITGFSTGLDVYVYNWLYRINGWSWSGEGQTGTIYSGDTLQLAFTSTVALSLTDYMIVHVWNYYTWFYVTTTDPLPWPTWTIVYPSWYYYNQTWFTIQITSSSGVAYEIFGNGFAWVFSWILHSWVNSIPVILNGTTWWNHVGILLWTSPYLTYDGSTFVLYDNTNPYFLAYVQSGMTITGTSFTFTGRVMDDWALWSLTFSGVANTSCNFSSSDLTWCNFTHTITFPGNGTQYITFNLTDKAGNTFPANDPIPVYVDLTDRMPDPFTFDSITNAVRSTPYGSSEKTVTGIETWVNVTVSAGHYRINWWSRVATTGTIYSWDTLEIRLDSSASYSTTVSSIVTVWYYTTTFSITTVAAPSWGWGGWWGWGGGWGSSCSVSSVAHGTINSSTCTITCDAWYTLIWWQCLVVTSTWSQELSAFSWSADEQKVIEKKINGFRIEFAVPDTNNTKFNNLINVLLWWIVSDATANKLSSPRLDQLKIVFSRFADALYAYIVDNNTLAKYQIVWDFKSIQWLLKPETSNTEFAEALAFLYSKGMTSYNTESAFRPNDTITREQAAKMYALFMQNVRGVNVQSTNDCNFTDLGSADTTLLASIRQVCGYGLMQWSNNVFRPKWTLTRAEAITLTIRALWLTVATTDPWYKWYIQIAATQGIVGTSTLDGAENTITRRDVAIMLYRASQK